MMWAVMAQAAPAPAVDCYAMGVKATADGRLQAALASFQAAFAHPQCRDQRGGLLLNVGVTLEAIAEQSGDVSFYCAAALRYRGVIEERATPEMLSAASLGEQRTLQLCGREPTTNEKALGQAGVAAVVGDGAMKDLAIGLTVGAGAGVVGGAVMLILAQRNGTLYTAQAALVAAAPNYTTLATEVAKLGTIQETITRQRTAGIVAIGAGALIGAGAIWAWIEAADDGPVVVPTGKGVVIGGTW